MLPTTFYVSQKQPLIPGSWPNRVFAARILSEESWRLSEALNFPTSIDVDIFRRW